MVSPTYVSNKDHIPKEPHWAIIEFSLIHVPGDERSRTHPGHGYPAHTETQITYKAFTDEDEWAFAVEELERQGRVEYKAMKVIPARVSTHVRVDID